MVPLPRYSTCAGIPITELLPKDQIDSIVKRTAGGGAEIVSFLKTGSAYYAPSAAAVEMTEAILKDKKKILPCAAYLEGEYGVNGLYVGVPCKLGARGLEQIIEINLTAEGENCAAKECCLSSGTDERAWTLANADLIEATVWWISRFKAKERRMKKKPSSNPTAQLQSRIVRAEFNIGKTL